MRWKWLATRTENNAGSALVRDRKIQQICQKDVDWDLTWTPEEVRFAARGRIKDGILKCLRIKGYFGVTEKCCNRQSNAAINRSKGPFRPVHISATDSSPQVPHVHIIIVFDLLPVLLRSSTCFSEWDAAKSLTEHRSPAFPSAANQLCPLGGLVDYFRVWWFVCGLSASMFGQGAEKIKVEANVWKSAIGEWHLLIEIMGGGEGAAYQRNYSCGSVNAVVGDTRRSNEMVRITVRHAPNGGPRCLQIFTHRQL